MLHYNPRHVSSINMTIFRRTNCIITASGIVTLCTVQYSMQDESGLQITIKELMIMLPLHCQNTAALQLISQWASYTSNTNNSFW
jgi:hypothetical protein